MATKSNIIDEQGKPVAIAKDGASSSRLAVDTDSAYKTLLDNYTTPNVTYIGKAAIGSATSAAVWQIRKIDTTTGLAITWAASAITFSNVWDNRASLSYG